MRKNKYLVTSLILGLILINNISCTKNTSLAFQNRLKSSPQYNDGKFHNKIDGLYDTGAAWRASFGEILFGNRVDLIPGQTLPIQKITGRDFYKNSDESIRFSRLGHSTILLQIGNKVWLTDPIFSERASPYIGPKRFHPAPIVVEELPPIEGVLISHNHYDHLDHDSIVKLKNRVKHFYVPLGLGQILVSWGVQSDKVTELDWWESKQIGNVELVSTPAQHFSGRGLFDTDETLWTSWVIRTSQHSVYFSGDTGYFEGFREIGEKYGPFELTFLECGGYHDSWRSMHMMPEDNLKAFKDLKGKTLVPIHNGTFDIAFHPWHDPMEKIMSLTLKEKIQTVIPLMGQIIDIKNIPKTINWWKP
ncbi:MBL fold metallo-hydrolase [bacterium]|nr:MBL fold metallo-hydrolase [bacterium]